MDSVEVGNGTDVDWIQIEVDMEDLVRCYFGGFACGANVISYGATSVISKDTSSITLKIAALGD
jgi:hypothetical protein